MSNARIKDATQAQIEAAWPQRSAWVSANAGSGKTRVLANRVAQLLLHGTEPAKILCLTFTKAGAAEMQNRLFRQLGEWAMLPEARLREALGELGESGLPAAQLLRARSLFARALETPGGLKIQTIHAFCESLLHRFPLEAHVAPDFELLTERDASDLRAAVLDEMAGDAPDEFAGFVEINGDPAGFLEDILKHQALFEHGFHGEAAAEVIGAEPDLTEAEILQRVFDGFSDEDTDRLAEEMLRHAKKHGEVVSNALTLRQENPASAALQALEAAFLTEGKPRSTTKFPVKAVKDAFSPALDMVTTFIERVSAARQARLALAAFEKAKLLHDFAVDFLGRYAQKKTALGALEFDDLIRKSADLLRQSDMAQWVLYRLDGGIDHILVDEAQDTSPKQWHIVAALAEEIYAAASDSPRTIFVVGDEKQSIFSFQGADPREFSRMKGLLHERLAAVNSPMFEGALQCSFRSAPPILQLVDKVFEGEARGGIHGEIKHIPVEDTLPGRIEIWPYYEKAETPEKPSWDAPVDGLAPRDPARLIAEDVADQVAAIIKRRQILPGTDRAVQAGDFLILVQSRGALFQALLKALKAQGVPLAGADRLKIAEELAVKDLLAVLQFAACPEDDLSLACALRSPLCGRSEREVFELAHCREGSLWQAVRPDEMLSDILRRADYDRPYELLERILIRHDGRKKLLARLGEEAREGVDELLRLALEYERQAAPSLTGFLNWIRADEINIKRQFNNENNLLRIMTVHGAKGLEAPIVILPQTVKRHETKGSPILPLGEGLAVSGLGTGDLPEALLEAHQSQKALQKEEKMRLLYVALTRAKNWLILAGSGKRDSNSDNWYDPVHAAATALGAKEDAQGRLVLENNWPSLAPAAETPEAVPYARLLLPEWLNMPAPKAIKPPRALNPSKLGGEHTIAGATASADALERGEQIHILLEHLAGLAPEARARHASCLLEAPLDGVIDEALAVLSAPDLAFLFAPGVLREAPVSATLEGIGRIAGRIDALVTGDTIMAVDFKSNPQVPRRADLIPEAFLRQMGAYRASLQQIWPDREIKTAILWTRNQRLMEIPADLGDAALKRIHTA